MQQDRSNTEVESGNVREADFGHLGEERTGLLSKQSLFLAKKETGLTSKR